MPRQKLQLPEFPIAQPDIISTQPILNSSLMYLNSNIYPAQKPDRLLMELTLCDVRAAIWQLTRVQGSSG